ncbi:polysialyltransferase family glycosyltransferase [Isoptericola jiangsuensis]|uniref:polysialyltransferase family glycosyltransferase n=1 Tax=Isoptericola jiangsuensis TaxID=548579 RepID=UPI003AAA5520
MTDDVTQIVVASTLFAAVGAAAAVDEGMLGTPRRRLWLSVNNATMPELTAAPHEIDGAAAVARRFDEVITLTDVLAPTHPSQWSPREQDLPMLERLLRGHWRIGAGPVQLVLESIAVNPARSLARVFDSASVIVHSEGLMSYGPTRDPLPWRTARRIDGMLHVDLVPGLVPRLLAEHGVRSEPVPAAALRTVFSEVAHGPRTDGSTTAARSAPVGRSALIVGQYLAAAKILERDQESRLGVHMVERAVEHGVGHVVFKPHPSAPPVLTEVMAQSAHDHGVTFEVLADGRPVETLFESLEPDVVVGCFSTALVTASGIYGIPVLAVDTATVLKQLVPMQNSNRVPLTIIDALFAEDVPRRSPQSLQQLVDGVAYTMQPEHLAHLRPSVSDFLSRTSPEDVHRYHRLYRLRDLGLPGAPPEAPSTTPRAARPTGRPRAVVRRMMGRAWRQARARATPGGG